MQVPQLIVGGLEAAVEDVHVVEALLGTAARGGQGTEGIHIVIQNPVQSRL